METGARSRDAESGASYVCINMFCRTQGLSTATTSKIQTPHTNTHTGTCRHSQRLLWWRRKSGSPVGDSVQTRPERLISLPEGAPHWSCRLRRYLHNVTASQGHHQKPLASALVHQQRKRRISRQAVVCNYTIILVDWGRRSVVASTWTAFFANSFRAGSRWRTRELNQSRHGTYQLVIGLTFIRVVLVKCVASNCPPLFVFTATPRRARGHDDECPS